jgi:hypothetical protein
LQLWTGNSRFGNSATLPAGSSKIEPGVTPAHAVILHWETFADAANEAGMSRRYGGIHFRAADLAGRLLGKAIARLRPGPKAKGYFDGSANDMCPEKQCPITGIM